MTRKELNQKVIELFTAVDKPWSELNTIVESPVWALQTAGNDSFDFIADNVPGHITPTEALATLGVQATDWSVFSIAFPRKHEIIDANAKAKVLPPKSWFSSKIVLRRDMPLFMNALISELDSHGIESLKPTGDLMVNDKIWSERHIGYACGLGSFGLNGGLITNSGVAIRLASLMIKKRFDVYDEVADKPFAACLYRTDGTCGACIKRCPNGAISASGHNVDLCRQQAYISNNCARVKAEYGLDICGCGLCLCGVPCSKQKPLK